ncbi:MAG: flagellar assembly protein FliW [Bdellovibrionales bacterium CG12_big_fil_rev_8_21_14_0_65_38_15]|nr:MAG: flagellar assembly protein FliW [Bdellovibrionales bacterium CG22_combo_CG10-13_8_21_14_all_38_13]PIQ57262.1 MAG: flagellar assembly protein FliW [Bdellovibrionales bacterium CG12_big_fil_rev_8_21_14_0_65_38_15]PIR29668.1 MAG: flagellar assembly protein FliW [Bdellovibrionales bacterium CG11_big_fil_rev_8_21_14_0_20_38_13]
MLEAVVKIKTTRFGELEVDKKDIINFKEGLLGFDTLTKFFVVDPGDQTLILWLQSVEDASTAFPMIEPKIFQADYSVKLLPAELTSLEIESLSEASVYTILTIPQTVTEMSANLKAPIIINNKTKIARQIVLQDSKLEVRFQMYKELKRHIVNYASDDTRRVRGQDNVVISTDTATNNSAPVEKETTVKTNNPEA